MLNRLKYFTCTALVLSLSSSIAIANPLKVKHTLPVTLDSKQLGKHETIGLLQLGSKFYESLGEDEKVIASEPVVKLSQNIDNCIPSIELLENLGNTFTNIGDYTNAKDLLEQSLQIARELKNPCLELTALHKLGIFYQSINDYQKALALTQQSLNIARYLKNLRLMVSLQSTLGNIYNNLGDYTKSSEYYQQVIISAQQLENFYLEGIALLNLSDINFKQGEPQKAVESAQKALVIFQQIKEPRLEAFAYRILGVGYGELGNDGKAMESAQNFLTFTRQVKNPVFEKSALGLLGSIHQKFGRKEQAIATYQEALSVLNNNQATGVDANIYAGLAQIYQGLNQPNTAIAYYKTYINQREKVRGDSQLPPQLQSSFLNTTVDFVKLKISDIYREFANLLFFQGRQQEVTEVLELLKAQEINEFSITRIASTNKPKLFLTRDEEKLTTPNQSIIALNKQISDCEMSKCQERTQLKDRLTTVVDEFNQELKKIEPEVSSRLGIDRGTFDPSNLEKAKEIAKQGTVMIYPLVLNDRLWLLLYSGDAARKFEVKVGREELGKAVKEFRDLMETCEEEICNAADTVKIKSVSQKLYNWLIKPLEPELQKNQVKNLVFALDRVTRYLPMSALFDGNQYLIENYTIYNVLSADLSNVSDRLPKGTQNTPVLAMGVSNAVGGFPPLSNVPIELNAIVRTSNNNRGIYPGKEFLNNAFDYRTLRDNLTGNKILHLATHGRFVPDSRDASYLLLGTGDKLTVDQIKTLTDLSNIHLVVLSACQTALAAPLQDGVEIASVAYYFLNRGAKAVMASLWQVSDRSTSDLMQYFYTNLAQNNQPTKAEALRLAQLSLLYSKQVTLNDIKRGAIDVKPNLDKPDRQTPTQTNFAHPYYWASFILIGNGL